MSRSVEYIFIEYSFGHNDFLCLHKLIGQVYVIRHVVFNKSHFLLFPTTNSLSSSKFISSLHSIVVIFFPSSLSHLVNFPSNILFIFISTLIFIFIPILVSIFIIFSFSLSTNFYNISFTFPYSTNFT